MLINLSYRKMMFFILFLLHKYFLFFCLIIWKMINFKDLWDLIRVTPDQKWQIRIIKHYWWVFGFVLIHRIIQFDYNFNVKILYMVVYLSKYYFVFVVREDNFVAESIQVRFCLSCKRNTLEEEYFSGVVLWSLESY